MSKARVNIHLIDLDAPEETLAAYWTIIDADERNRAERFRTRELRRRWVVARAALRDILACYTSTRPSGVQFEFEANGKPILASPQHRDSLHFNLSHSNSRALVGVSDFGPIGVDLEYERPIRDWRDVSQRFFSADEMRQLESIPETERLSAFYRCWTRKEAVIKASGEGLSARLDAFDVSLTPQVPARVLGGQHAGVAATGWHLEDLHPGTGYVGALALSGCHDVCVDSRGFWRLSYA